MRDQGRKREVNLDVLRLRVTFLYCLNGGENSQLIVPANTSSESEINCSIFATILH